jgi:hypothetical protein
MAWLKRNLIFVVSGLVALGVLGFATIYMMSKKELNETVTADLQNKQSEWNRLNQKDPHPGTDSLDNITAAQVEQKKVTAVLEEARTHYEMMNATNTIDNATFKKMLDDSLYELKQQASASGVETPQDFGFTFTSQRNELRFPEASLVPLKSRLEDIKDICSVLYNSKVHGITSLKRPAVAEEESALGAQDYHSYTPVTNSLAVITPYELTFRGFSAEVASVLHGFATSEKFMVVKWVKSARGQNATFSEAQPMMGMGPMGMDSEMAARYGLSGGMGRPGEGSSSAPNYSGGGSSAPSYQQGGAAGPQSGGGGTAFRDAYGAAPGSAAAASPYGPGAPTSRGAMESAYGAGAGRDRGQSARGGSRAGRAGRAGRGGSADPYGGRYGQTGPGTGLPGYGAAPGGYPQNMVAPQVRTGGPETVLDEEPLSITLRVDVVTLLDPSMKGMQSNMGGGYDSGAGYGGGDPMMNQQYPMNY